jgi:hypothetical protein
VIAPRRSKWRALRVLATAGVAGVLATAVFTTQTKALTLPTPYVALTGEGSWGVQQQLVPWENQLATASKFINLNYNARGSFFGRQDLAQGVADFAISGRPYTTAELAKVKGGASAFISAPISVSTLATFVEPPYPTFLSLTVKCDPDDPSTWPPGVTDGSTQCVVKAKLTGPVKIPNRNLVAMYLNFGGPSDANNYALNDWNNQAIVDAMGVQQFVFTSQPFVGPDVADRSDPDEISYYLQQFESTAAPALWRDNQKAHPGSWQPITERLPVFVGVSRDGAEQQVDQLAQNGSGVGGLRTGVTVQGGIAAAPPSTLISMNSTFPQQEIHLAEMQNANGDWVAPTPASINKAIDAGGATPLYALTNKVPGAYPLVWVDDLYAPAHGLSIEKTEGLATLIRYLATTGQKGAAAVGEGRLPAALVAKALAAANALVQSNCQGSDRQIVTNTDPGPLAPATATEMKSIGSIDHCEPAPGATTTTAAPSTTATTVPSTPGATSGSAQGGFDSSSGNPSSLSGAGDLTGTGVQQGTGGPHGTVGPGGVGGTRPGTRPAASAGHVNALLTASKLPLPIPGGPGADRLATFMLGAVLYLVLRKPVARLARRIST